MHLNADLCLSESQIGELVPQALGGAPEAAFRLFLVYGFCLTDINEGFFWLEIAAENGHAVGQYNLGYKLIEDNKPTGLLRGRFWVERAAANGNSAAWKMLQSLPAK